MRDKSIHLYVFPGFADWEPAHAVAELRRNGGYEVEVISTTLDPVKSMGGVKVVPTRRCPNIRTRPIMSMRPQCATAGSSLPPVFADVEFARELMAELDVLSADDRALWSEIFRSGRLPASQSQ